MILKRFFYILFLILITGNAYTQENLAFINIDKVLNDSNYGKSLLKEIKLVNEKNIKILQEKEIEISNEDKELQGKKNIYSETEFQLELIKFKNKLESYAKLKNDMVEDIEKRRDKILNNFFLEINPIIENFMSENSIDILFEQKNVYIGINNLDITDDIIEQLNKIL
ncbi:OmpH family outer membrane protein [Candidatus Pelagibacter sp. HIMB1748]|uniref:OmpH family outer membrane protein n=1 Tax=unclassified Candidatus Pelagibacter TaxID=2647897 RepID=UPI003F82B408